MKVGIFSKQPGERISNSILYGEALDEGDAIAMVTGCCADPADLLVTPVLVAADRVRIWAEGGEDGVSYKITLRVETQGGEVLEDELVCKVKEI